MADNTTGVTIAELTPTTALSSADRFEVDRKGGAYSITYANLVAQIDQSLGITEGRNRQIRRMMKAVRCLVLQLKRLSVDGIPLDETLAPGEWKEIFPK